MAKLGESVDEVWSRAEQADHVRVYRRADSSTYFSGLRVCGSAWMCPVCAAKISERRRSSLALAVEAHRAAGGEVALMTLTCSHSREDEVFSLLDSLLKAFRSFGAGRNRWQEFTPGLVGSVRALEVTHGDANGWHPHLHVLVFLEAKTHLGVTRETLAPLWISALARHGLTASELHGFSLHNGEYAAQYVGKWGLAEELTKAHIKMGRKGGKTPWALLSDYADGDARSGQLFVEFVEKFKGRSQLHWSRGLLDELEGRYDIQLRELRAEDDDLASDKVDSEDYLAARIPHSDWKIISRFHLQGRVLEILRLEDYSGVEKLLERFRAPPPLFPSEPECSPRASTPSSARRVAALFRHPCSPGGFQRDNGAGWKG